MKLKDTIGKNIILGSGEKGTILDCSSEDITNVNFTINIDGKEKSYAGVAFINGFITFEDKSVQKDMDKIVENYKTRKLNFKEKVKAARSKAIAVKQAKIANAKSTKSRSKKTKKA